MQVHIRLFADKEQSAASTQSAVACPLLRCLAVAARALAIPVMQWKNLLEKSAQHFFAAIWKLPQAARRSYRIYRVMVVEIEQ